MPEHLTLGSSEPALSPGKLRLYGMRFCPFDHRVHLVLIAKNILHDSVWINLKNKPEWYIQRIPSGKVPGLVVEGEGLYESLIVADYLDEQYPGRQLHSAKPLQRAKDRILIDNFGKVTAANYKFLYSDSSNREHQFDIMLTEMGAFEEELITRKTKFFGGNEPGMVDYMIWPWMERFPALKLVHGKQFDFPESKMKHLAAWSCAMREDEVVKQYALPAEVYASYLKSSLAGTPDYNMSV